MDEQIVIRHAYSTFKCTLVSPAAVMKLPQTNVKKLWKIMFESRLDNEENEKSIRKFKEWFDQEILVITDELKAAKDILSKAEPSLEYEKKSWEYFVNVTSKLIEVSSKIKKEQQDKLLAANNTVTAATRAISRLGSKLRKTLKLQQLFNKFDEKWKPYSL